MKKPISEKISELRKAKNLTQEQLGEQLGVSGQAVSKWENGSSMPDILLLPELCELLDTSLDALLEVSAARKRKNIVSDFCAYARETGRAHAVQDVIARLFNDVGANPGGNNLFFSSDEIYISDEHGLGAVIEVKDFSESCLQMPQKDIVYFLHTLTDDACFSVLRQLSIDDATTAEELCEKTGLDPNAINRAVLALMERNLVCVGMDNRGKRGYLLGAVMAGILLILAGCRISGCGAETIPVSVWSSRK